MPRGVACGFQVAPLGEWKDVRETPQDPSGVLCSTAVEVFEADFEPRVQGFEKFLHSTPPAWCRTRKKGIKSSHHHRPKQQPLIIATTP
ncbi:MAG: hypothetical protein M3436_00835 [Pseudomonadota bacterium]|nr:hypothetical protein [Pseudomonadota bacterium]